MPQDWGAVARPVPDEVLLTRGLSGGLIAAALSRAKPDGGPRTASVAPHIGIVSMTKRPADLQTWLLYHRERCGISRFYLRVEDTPELAALLDAPPWSECVQVTFSTGHRDYFQQMDRQDQHIATILPAARAVGLDYLLHIDDDELLYCADGLDALHDALARAPSWAADLHVSNLEVLAPSTEVALDRAFHECTAFRHRPREFCAYGNGKAFGKLSEAALRPAGPHHFAAGLMPAGSREAGTYDLPANAAVVLHYESGSYAAWRRKYTDLARRHGASGNTDYVAHRAPSEFYAESMAAMAAVVAAQTSGAHDTHARAEAAARATFSSWKLAPEGTPLPPPRAAPVILRDIGITVIDIFAQPRVPHPTLRAPADDLVRPRGEAPPTLQRKTEGMVDVTDVTDAARHTTADTPALATSKPATRPATDATPVPSALLLACRDGAGGDLAELLQFAAGSGGAPVDAEQLARHVDALAAAGVADAAGLLTLLPDALDAALRRAKGVSIGVRHRVKSAVTRVRHAARPGG